MDFFPLKTELKSALGEARYGECRAAHTSILGGVIITIPPGRRRTCRLQGEIQEIYNLLGHDAAKQLFDKANLDWTPPSAEQRESESTARIRDNWRREFHRVPPRP